MMEVKIRFISFSVYVLGGLSFYMYEPHKGDEGAYTDLYVSVLLA